MSDASPSLVPSFDVTVYLVLDDFGKLGRSYLETDEENPTRIPSSVTCCRRVPEAGARRGLQHR